MGAADWPTREDLRYGLTVEIDQETTDNDDLLVGEIEKILTEEHTHPEGIEVKLQNGAVGRVRRIATDE